MAGFAAECSGRVSLLDGDVLNETTMEVSSHANEQGEENELDEETTDDDLLAKFHRVEGSHSHDTPT